MNKKLNILAICLLCFTLLAQATDINEKDWNRGKIVLQDGTSYSGELKYDLKQNVAMIKQKGTIKAFSAHQVDYFRFMDIKRKTLRRFYTMPYENQRGIERLMFFELVFQDGFVLFNRERTVRKRQAMLSELPFMSNGTNRNNERVTVFSYFIFMPDGQFKPLQAEQQDLIDKLALSKEERKDMRDFIHDHDINLKNRSDFIRLLYEIVNNNQT
jgi:hypothetical protein